MQDLTQRLSTETFYLSLLFFCDSIFIFFRRLQLQRTSSPQSWRVWGSFKLGLWQLVSTFSSNHSLTYNWIQLNTIEYDFAILHKSCCGNCSAPHFSSNQCFIHNQLYVHYKYNCKQVLRGRLKHLPRRSTIELWCSVQVFFSEQRSIIVKNFSDQRLFNNANSILINFSPAQLVVPGLQK